MAKQATKQVSATNAPATAAATVTAAPQPLGLAAMAAQAATVTAAPATKPRHYGVATCTAATLPTSLVKRGAETPYMATARGLQRLAGQAAKAAIDNRYQAAAVLLQLAAAGAVTPTAYWHALPAALVAPSALAGSKKGASITPDEVFNYYVRMGFLVAQA